MKTYKQFVAEANEVKDLNEFVGAALKAYQYGSKIVNPILRVGGPLYGAWKWRERDKDNVPIFCEVAAPEKVFVIYVLAIS